MNRSGNSDKKEIMPDDGLYKVPNKHDDECKAMRKIAKPVSVAVFVYIVVKLLEKYGLI